MSKIGINGFGRIGRLVLRRLLEVKMRKSSRQMSLARISVRYLMRHKPKLPKWAICNW